MGDNKKNSIAGVISEHARETVIGLLDSAVENCPDKPFVMFPDHNGYGMSYSDAYQGARCVANALRNKGIKPGGRVAIYLSNSPTYIWAWMGVLMAAAVDVTVNTGLRGTSLAYVLGKARVDAIITNRAGVANLASISDNTHEPPIILLEDDEAGISQQVSSLKWGHWDLATGLEPIIAGDHDRAFKCSGPFELSSIRFTSGSTGFPKGVMMSQAHMLANARMYNHVSGLGAADTLYTCFPVHHVFASVMGILSVLCAQATLVLARKFSASQFWHHVRHYGVTISQILDAPAAILLTNPESEQDRNHPCRVMYTTSVDMPRFEERFGVRIARLFDMSELTAITYYPEGLARREGSCGVSSGLFDICILDDDDCPVAVGEEGQIAVRPRIPHVMMMGYFDDADLTVERWSNLWYHTNDRGVLDADGYLYFKGRLGDRIRRRGVNVSASELEAIAGQHSAVAESAVIAVPAELGEDEIKLCVTLRQESSATPAELLEHMSRNLPKSLVPRYVEIRTGFPRTDTEKIRKNVLREEGNHGLTASTWDVVTQDFIAASATEDAGGAHG